ncbi:SDR family NAD(P)-dependent oxidoreductase [Roseibium sp. MMSF_3412]|uniref:SDR family NAD(P)-dependent oxidoreductase n=1 Tax=Roseibium sp. MMSF_3412 TaxID=3046712 RepID=UPI00273FA2C6|nr:SDR family NAD(P)-dependent oxidoreductase [Roseibium sp. MMSF_3412]
MSGRRALVTGANRGIGLAIAKGLAVMDCHVFLGARDLTVAKKVAHAFDAQAVELDVSNQDSISRAVDAIGTVDILVNNAGVLGSGNLLDDPEDFERSMSVMVHGPYRLMHLLAPAMVRNRYGRIVNVSSGWGAFSDGVSGPAAYGVAKAALNALTVASARTLPENVKVNAMCPGWVRTRMGGAAATRSPEEGADTAIWLATLDQDGPTGGFFRDRKRFDW